MSLQVPEAKISILRGLQAYAQAYAGTAWTRLVDPEDLVFQ